MLSGYKKNVWLTYMPPKKKNVLYNSEPESESEDEIVESPKLTEMKEAVVNLPKSESLGEVPKLTNDVALLADSEFLECKGRTKKRNRGRPTIPDVEPVVKKETQPMQCPHCKKVYSRLFNLNRHLEDNRCVVKRDMDKAEANRLNELALKALSDKKKAKLTITNKDVKDSEELPPPVPTKVKKPRVKKVKEPVEQEQQPQPVAPAVPAPQQFTLAPSGPKGIRFNFR
jgi:hypothetical protein